MISWHHHTIPAITLTWNLSSLPLLLPVHRWSLSPLAPSVQCTKCELKGGLPVSGTFCCFCVSFCGFLSSSARSLASKSCWSVSDALPVCQCRPVTGRGVEDHHGDTHSSNYTPRPAHRPQMEAVLWHTYAHTESHTLSDSDLMAQSHVDAEVNKEFLESLVCFMT